MTKAQELINSYTMATKADLQICDHSFTPIAELNEYMQKKESPCSFCKKYQAQSTCQDMHINALRESHSNNGTNVYVCPLGLYFWTSPLYDNDRYTGAMVGSGFPSYKKEEAAQKMSEICNGEVSKEDLKKIIDSFPSAEPGKIKALSELANICARSLYKENSEAQKEDNQEYELIKDEHEYSLAKEKEFLSALKKGELKTAKLVLEKILDIFRHTGSKEFKLIQNRAMELSLLMLRTGNGPGINTRTSLETGSLYINSIQEAKNTDEVATILYRLTEDITTQINSYSSINHSSAIKRAEYYILENYTRKVSLEEIAKASGFSPPYFSTIFKEEMGENLSSYLNRLRVEKAKIMLINTNYALKKIARSSGFEDQSWFSKIFKHYTGTSPGKYRNQAINSAFN